MVIIAISPSSSFFFLFFLGTFGQAELAMFSNFFVVMCIEFHKFHVHDETPQTQRLQKEEQRGY
jgi:hypothetical protein